MNLIYLQTFKVVAEQQSFTKAAETIGVSKGLVSRHIVKLENSLALKLFHRTTRSLNLTEAGEKLLYKAKQIQQLATEAEIQLKDMTQEMSGELKVTAPLEFGRMLCRHVIPNFQHQHPTIKLQLDFGPLKKMIEIGDFDIAFRAYDILPSNVIAKNIGNIRNVLVCDNRFQQKQQIKTIEQLQHCQFIENSQNKNWNQLNLFKNDQHRLIKLSGSIRCNTYHSILELVRQSMGVASLPYYQVEDLINTGQLFHLLPEYGIKTHPLSIIYAQRKTTPLKIQAFYIEVQKWLQSNVMYLI